MRGHRLDWWRRGVRSVAALTVVVLLVGVFTSLAIGSALRDAADQSAIRAMDGRTDLVATAVRTEVDRYLDQMRTLAAALGAVESLTAATFSRTTAPLGPMGLPGATSIAFLVPVAHQDVAAVQADWRRRGSDGLVIQPYGTGQHVIAVLSARLDGRTRLIHGLDLTPAPAASAQEARESDTVTVSDTYQLLVDRQLPPASRQNSFVLTAPVHGFEANGSRTFRGWLMMSLRGHDFIRTTLARAAQNLLDVSLTARNADGRQTVVASVTVDATGRRDQHRTVDLPIAQRRWALRTAAVSGTLPGGGQMLAAASTAALLGLTALLAALVGTLADARRRAERQVRVATREVRAAEKEARDQARLLGTVLDTITEGVGVVDQQGAFLAYNPAAKRLVGIGPGAAEPHQWQQHYGLFRPDGSEPFPVDELPLLRALAGEAPDHVEMLVCNPQRPDGVLITVSARQLELADGSHGAVAVFHDVTAVRAHEAELQGFAGVVAHDLKSPLAVVLGYAELLEEILEEEAPGDARERGLASVERIRVTADRMRRLIDDLLAYTSAREAVLQTVTVPLGDLVHSVIALRLEATRTRGLFPDLYVGPLPPAKGDPVLIRQVVDNLVGNALKYTPPGRPARIDITGRIETDSAGLPWVRVDIADRGIGLPVGEHSRVFARFHRAHAAAAYPGTGLGLAICQRIVERHGGAIGATDNPGGGTRFWFTLPLGDDPPADPPTAFQAALTPGISSSGRSSSA